MQKKIFLILSFITPFNYGMLRSSLYQTDFPVGSPPGQKKLNGPEKSADVYSLEYTNSIKEPQPKKADVSLHKEEKPCFFVGKALKSSLLQPKSTFTGKGAYEGIYYTVGSPPKE